jgi:hypothetical protein
MFEMTIMLINGKITHELGRHIYQWEEHTRVGTTFIYQWEEHTRVDTTSIPMGRAYKG